MTAAAEKPARSMRELMPRTFAWLQGLRAAFGADIIDPQIRAATLDGLPTFHASEAGHSAGTPLPAAGCAVCAADMVINPPKKDAAHAPRR